MNMRTLLLFIVMASGLAGCATTTPREAEFNARLIEQADKSQSAKSANEAFTKSTQALIKKGEKTKDPLYGETFKLKNAQDARELVRVLTSWPGTPAPTQKAREMILAADIDLDRPELKHIFATQAAPAVNYLDAYRLVIASADGLHLGGKFRREVVALFSKQLHSAAQSPAVLVEAAIDIAILGLMSEQGWLDPHLAPEIKKLEADERASRAKVLEALHTAFKDANHDTYSKTERLRYISLMRNEMREATHLMKRAAALVKK